jgi:hypothetical protein
MRQNPVWLPPRIRLSVSPSLSDAIACFSTRELRYQGCVRLADYGERHRDSHEAIPFELIASCIGDLHESLEAAIREQPQILLSLTTASPIAPPMEQRVTPMQEEGVCTGPVRNCQPTQTRLSSQADWVSESTYWMLLTPPAKPVSCSDEREMAGGHRLARMPAQDAVRLDALNAGTASGRGYDNSRSLQSHRAPALPWRSAASSR